MKVAAERIAWAAVATGAAWLAGWAVDKAARRGWQSVTGEDPPADPASTRTDWRDALVWTATTSLALGLGRLLTTRLAAAGWTRVAGESPPN